MVSARALSSLSPTLPTEGFTPEPESLIEKELSDFSWL